MDPEDSILSHQFDIVTNLSAYYNKIYVVTGKVNSINFPKNVIVLDTKWKPGSPIGSIFRLIQAVSKLKKEKIDVVFYHMVDVQASILCTYFKMKRIKQYLWYAHAHKSVYLNISSFFCDGIISSTEGSCPIDSKKVKLIGQSIDETLFQNPNYNQGNLTKLVHFGRIDKIKNIDKIICEVAELRSENIILTLDFFGREAVDKTNSNYLNYLKLEFANFINEGWLNFHEPVKRTMIPELIRRFHIFVHAYLGSLDKSILEATFLGIPVVTLNKEYLKEFGTWGANNDLTNIKQELRALLNLGLEDRTNELIRRRNLAMYQHSMTNWIHKLIEILND